MKIYRVENVVEGHGPYAGWSANVAAHVDRLCDCDVRWYRTDPFSHAAFCDFREAMEFHERMMWDNSVARPIPTNDGIGSFPHHWIFGFVALEALWEWFDDFLDDLDRWGYEIVEYIAEGGKAIGYSGQVAFNPDYARKV